MDNYQFISFILRLLCGACASFFAILNWSRNRDIAWFFIILGTLTLYISSVFDILVSLHVIIPEFLTINGVSFFQAFSIFVNIVPFLLFSVGFIIMLRRKL